jgi:asparagine synthase (glutamine-hydrolysing)
MCPTGETMADVLPEVVRGLDEPFESPTAVVQYLLMREARARGIKVVLNGHGSDEIFGGYPRFMVPYLAGLLLAGRPLEYASECRSFGASGRATPRNLPRQLLAAVTPAGLKPGFRRLLSAARGWRGRPYGGIYSEAVETARRSRGDADSRGSAAGTPVSGRLSPLNAALWQNFSRDCLPRWLRMEDRMSMASSVEARLPFMDYRVVEFAFNLPDGLKLKNGYTKYIVRRAFWDRLPERIVRNRFKKCFGTPYPAWFRGAWRPMVEDLLLCGSCRVGPYLCLPEFRARARAYLDGQDRALSDGTLWRVLNTELWLRAFGGGAAAA